MARIVFVLVLSILSAFVTACGKRPSTLEPPEGSTYRYPQTYPDPLDRVP